MSALFMSKSKLSNKYFKNIHAYLYLIAIESSDRVSETRFVFFSVS